MTGQGIPVDNSIPLRNENIIPSFSTRLLVSCAIIFNTVEIFSRSPGILLELIGIVSSECQRVSKRAKNTRCKIHAEIA